MLCSHPSRRLRPSGLSVSHANFDGLGDVRPILSGGSLRLFLSVSPRPDSALRSPNVALDVVHDVLLADPAEDADPGRAHLMQEPAVAGRWTSAPGRVPFADSRRTPRISGPARLIGSNAAGAIEPASRSTDSHRFSAARPPSLSHRISEGNGCLRDNARQTQRVLWICHIRTTKA
jgi:hypothetical protein